MAKGAKFIHIGMDGMNYLLFRRFLAEGCLPNFAKLVARGTINRLMPSIPAWTPTNWAAQITGAHPGTHGLSGWTKHRKADPRSIPSIQSWESREWSAETVWQVAEEAGLTSLITHYPVGTWPSPIKQGYVIAPGFREPPFILADSGEYFCAPRHEGEKAQESAPRLRSVDVLEEGAPPGSTVVELAQAAGGWEGELPILLHSVGEEKLWLRTRLEDGGELSIYAKKGDTQPLLELRLGEWSPFIIRDFGGQEGSVRFRWLGSSSGPRLHLARSQVYATQGFAYPEGLAQELVREVGPFFTRYAVTPRADAELAAFLDDVRYQGLWEAGVACYMQEHHGWDLHFSHWHIFDFINHPTINPADPEGPSYDPEVGAWNIQAQRRAYEIADEVLAEFLKLADEDTHIMVVSDHAMPPAHRWADVNLRLAEAGLMAFEPATRQIDLARSRVYTWPERGAEVFVNLAGREPTGIVLPQDCEKVQEEIIDALLDWRDPETGKRIIALALKLEDAQLIGYWGEDQGDAVFLHNHGMGWGAVPGGGSVGPGKGAIHGSQVPTYETAYFTTMGMMLLAGPQVKSGGYERDWRRWGLIREIDVAPTICHLVGLRLPERNQGAAPFDLLI